MATELKHWQIEDAHWLATRRHALLANEMRTGKTLTALEAARQLCVRSILVICPAIARSNWARNIQEHLDIAPQVMFRRDDTPSSLVCVTSYELAAAPAKAHWDLVIVDESHYLRRCDAGRTKMILGKEGLIHRAGRMWFLSGTPAVNNYSELWQILHVCGRYAGGYDQFVREFCHTSWGPYGLQIRGSKNSDGLRELMGTFISRRKFAEIAPHLPAIELSEYTVDCPRGADALDAPEIRDALNAPDPMAALESIAPAMATLRRYIGLAKVPVVAELVTSELEETTGKIVLFTYHVGVLEELARLLQGHNPVSICGGDTPLQRDRALQTFKIDNDCRVFIGQIVAAGTAIDLSAASNAMFVESSWVPGENLQAVMRLQNMSADNKVTARFIGMAGSLDQQIQRVVQRKTKELSKLLD